MKKIAITLVIAIALLFCFGTVALAADGSFTGTPCNKVTTDLSSFNDLTFCDGENNCYNVNDLFSSLQSMLNSNLSSLCANGSCSGLFGSLNQSGNTDASNDATCTGSDCTADDTAVNTGSGCWGGWGDDSSCGGWGCSASDVPADNSGDSDDATCTGSDCAANDTAWSGNWSDLMDWLNQQGGEVVTDDNDDVTPPANGNSGSDVTPPANGNSGSGTVTTPPSQQNETYAQAVFRLTNEERVANGLPALKSMTILDKAAYIRSTEQESIFSHTRPDGRSCFTVLEDLGISYTRAGENIAMGYTSPESVVTGWMNSPGHRANILNASFTTLGVGVYQGADGTLYWSQEFLTQ